jgi:hypothetical protein
MSELVFSTTERQEIPITIDGKKYVLKEFLGKDRDAFLTSLNKRMNYTSGQFSGVRDYNGLQASLISRCLFDENDALVDTNVIQLWPAKMLSAIYVEAQKINLLESNAETEAKNA